jgi:hypothetical protein
VQRITARLAESAPSAFPLPSGPWTHASLFAVLTSDRSIDGRAEPARPLDRTLAARQLQPDSVFAARHVQGVR